MIIHPWIERPFDSSFCTLVTVGRIFLLKLDQRLLNQTPRCRWYHNAESTVSLMYWTQGAGGSQPAMKTRRNENMNEMCEIKDVNVCMNVMYNVCACCYRVL